MSPRCEVDRTTLTRAVGNALGSATVALVDSRAESIHTAFNQSTAGLFRVSGTALDRDEVVPWRLILKVTGASDDVFGGSRDPGHTNYWRREAQTYQSGLLDRLPAIGAPRCFGVDERADATTWIWLEDVGGPHDTCWPVSRYRVAARRLGAFNSAYLTGLPLPAAGC